MHCEKASSWEFVELPEVDEPLPDPVDDAPVLGDPAEPTDDGLLLHAASRASMAVEMLAAVVRAAFGGHARPGRRITRML
jgi:hypothetical protein